MAPFDVRVLAADPQRDEAFGTLHDVDFVAPDELLSRSDVVSLHLPYSPAVHQLLGREQLALMKPTAVLVNCARGGIVDEGALFDALQSGQMAGAHIDTFENEPYAGPLIDLDNVTLSPHIGSYAVESRISMESEAVHNLVHFFEERR